MSCEDCENYKPKEVKKVPTVLKEIEEKIHYYCVGKDCQTCVVDLAYSECPIWSAHNKINELEVG